MIFNGISLKRTFPAENCLKRTILAENALSEQNALSDRF
ncbi:hypothetical protein T09_11935 [Trichinella sp. T9]|nr:hypothetical protein T09_11935 [Trichinella sp. T9]